MLTKVGMEIKELNRFIDFNLNLENFIEETKSPRYCDEYLGTSNQNAIF